ncbi:MAG TPA: universal stress protein [Solirubrobacteraceae bacterium]|nr:universal stress protein [Solirubrobacteraceae bacterium]
MFRQVLVGVGDDKGSRDAIALSKLLAGGAAVTFGHIFYEDTSAAPWGFEDPRQGEAAREFLERLAEEAGVPAHLRWEGAPSVGRGLHEMANAIDADLIVVGSSRHSRLGRVGVPDHTHAALDGARCAVAVATAGYATAGPAAVHEIGVGYDGSAESAHALAVAKELAGELGAKVSAFQAVAAPMFGYSGLSTTQPSAATIEGMVKRAGEAMAGLGVDSRVTYGDPAEELTVYSASVDLLIMGSRGYGPIGRLFNGSTARSLASTARCPLLVLPRGARDPSAEPASQSSSDAMATTG